MDEDAKAAEHTAMDAQFGVSDEVAWGIFESEARRCLGISASDFIKKFDSGFWPDPDDAPGVLYVQSVRRFAGQSKPTPTAP